MADSSSDLNKGTWKPKLCFLSFPTPYVGLIKDITLTDKPKVDTIHKKPLTVSQYLEYNMDTVLCGTHKTNVNTQIWCVNTSLLACASIVIGNQGCIRVCEKMDFITKGPL